MTQFFRVRLYTDPGAGGEARCALTGPQGSGLVRSLRDADALAVVPEGVDCVMRHDPVNVILLHGRR